MAPLRLFVIAPLLSVLAAEESEANPIDRRQTSVMVLDRIRFQPWDNLPSGSGEMAKLYGDFDKPGAYLVMMKWKPRLVQRSPQLLIPRPG